MNGARYADAFGSIGTEKRRNPYPPIFRSTPARITEPAVGASTCASGSQVWTGHIGTLTAKDAKKASHSQYCQQHQHRAEQRVEEELERGIDAALPAPDADDQVHRDQHGLEEHIEQD